MKCEKEAQEISNFQLFSTPKPLEDVPFFNMKGEKISLKDYKGKTLVLNHWAIWCAPCLREMPSFLRLSEKVKDKNIVVLPLSMDRSGVKKVHRFVIKKKWSHLAFFNDPKMNVARKAAINTIPATQIINQEGREVGRLVGTYEWDSPEVIRFLDCLTS